MAARKKAVAEPKKTKPAKKPKPCVVAGKWNERAFRAGLTPRGPGITIDLKKADRVINFIEENICHWKGEFAGRPFKLLPWQKEFIYNVFAPVYDETGDRPGKRAIREAYVEIPRKNGKTTLLAGIALYLLCADGEPGAEVYIVAADRGQASIMFDDVVKFVQASPRLSQHLEVYARSVVYSATQSKIAVLSSDADTKHGFNAHAVLGDEIHVWRGRGLYDVLRSSQGARSQPLFFGITTAGYDRLSLCWQLHEYTEKIRTGILSNPKFFGVIYGAGPDDDWKDPATWRKANPSLGEAVKEDYLREECKVAQEMPTYENTFRQLHLDQWTEQAERFMPMDAWDEAAKVLGTVKKVTLEELRGRVVYLALDLSSVNDLTALAYVAPNEDGTFDVAMRFWVPDMNVRRRVEKDRVPFDVWIRDGFMESTPGNVIDYDFILYRICQDTKAFALVVREIAFDPHNAHKLVNELTDEGYTMVEFRQGFISMGPAMKTLLSSAMAGRIRHSANPVLRWNMSNMVARKDPAGNFKPDKEKSQEKIDGAVALIMALQRASVMGAGGGGAYDDEGAFVSLEMPGGSFA